MLSEDIEIAKKRSDSDTQPSKSQELSETEGIWKWFDKRASEREKHRTEEIYASLEMHHYVEARLLPRKDDLFSFWKDHAAEYPRLSSLTKKYLCTPATSVPSESLYSKAGELVSVKRSRVKPKHINTFLSLNKNVIK